MPATGNYSGYFAILCVSSNALVGAFVHILDLVVGKPIALRLSAGTDPGSTIMQQAVGGHSESALQDTYVSSLGGVVIWFK